MNRLDVVKAVAQLASMNINELRHEDAHTPPQTDEDLWEYIAAYCGFKIPRVAVCKNHGAPFQAIADLFFERVNDAILFANRLGGKTQSLAILHHLNAEHKPRYETASLGAIQEQALKCYGYVGELIGLPWFAGDTVSSLMKRTMYRNGSLVQVLSGTTSGVNCLSGDTIIDTLDGKHRIKDLVGKKDFFVHVWDEENRRHTVDRVLRVWKSGAARVWKITFDKSVLFATFDHPVRLMSGEYMPAGLLRPGHKVRVLNRGKRWDGNKAYWTLYPPPENRGAVRYRPEHRWVMEEMLGCDIDSDVVVHHIDNDSTNNQPWNLQTLSRVEHSMLTRKELGVWSEGKERPEHAAFMRDSIALEKERGEYENRLRKLRETWTEERREKWAKQMSTQVAEQWKDPVRRERAQRTWRNQTTIDDAPWRDANRIQELLDDGLYPEAIAERLGCSETTIRKWMRYHNLNHVVMKVEPIGEEDVYDITTEVYHNFFANNVNVSNSPHPICAVLDEVELMSRTILQEALSMPQSSRGYKATLILTSTRKYPSGMMQQLLDEADERNYKVYSWCLFESVAKCTLPDCEQCKEVTRVKQGKLESWYDICHEDPERHPRGKCRASDGFIILEDIMNKFVKMDWDVFDAQWRCHKPGRKGLVFGSFDEEIHCKPELIRDWHNRLRVDRFERPVMGKNEEGRIIEIHPRELEIAVTIDMGWADPLATLFTAKDQRDNLFLFDSIYESGLDLRDYVPMMRKKMAQYAIPPDFTLYCDERAPRQIDKLNKLGLKVEGISAPVDERVMVFRQWLDGNYREGQPTVCIEPANCKPFCDELNVLHYKLDKEGNPMGELPDKGPDHLVDCAGYMMKAFDLIKGFVDVRVIRHKDPPVTPPKVPTSSRWARGITIDGQGLIKGLYGKE